MSDLRFSRSEPTATNRLGEAQADLLLAFDQLVAASDRGLKTAHAEKTTVVGSTTATPTGEMITHLEIELPTAASLIERIASRSRSQAQFWADAAAVTEDLFGNTTNANLFVVGMAVQAGCLPVTPVQIEEAIGLNNVGVAENRAAFGWGRAQIAMPEKVEAARKERQPVVETRTVPEMRPLSRENIRCIETLGLSEIDRGSIERFSRELLLWGRKSDLPYFLEVAERVTEAEDRIQSGSRRLTTAVAANLFKLMAYKDEYEVARLMTDRDGISAATEAASHGDRIAWKLHPPLLRVFGLSRKLTIGSWATPLIRGLANAKFLRGTPLDLFGYAKVRRLERVLPREYVDTIDRVLPSLRTENLDAIARLAELPDGVRGYEDLKLARIEIYRAELDRAAAGVSDSRMMPTDAPPPPR